MSEPATIEETGKPEPPAHLKGAMAAIFLIVLSDLMGFGLIIPLLPFYAKAYAASDFQVGLLFSVYSGCQLLASPLLGLMSDRFGRRPVLLLSQIGSVIGFVLLGVATHSQLSPAVGLMLVYISRVIDGFSGGNISTAQAYISDVTTKENRAKGMGMLGAAFGIGFSIGPAVGGLLGHYNVSYPAFAAAALSGTAALMTYFRLPESKHHETSESELWLHPSKFLPILRNSPLVQMLLIFFFSMMAFVMLEACFALFLKEAFGYGPRQVGAFFGFVGVIIIIVQGGLIGRLTKRFGEWPLVIIGPLLVSLAMALYVEAGWRPLLWILLIAGFFNAAGRSLQTPTLSALISHIADPKQQGTVFGLFHMLGSLARVIGPIIAMSVFTRHHTAPFIVAGAITLAAALWTVALRGVVERSPQVALEV